MDPAGVERSDRDEPDVDDSWGVTSCWDGDCRTAAWGPAKHRTEHANRNLFLRGSYLLRLGQRGGIARYGKHAPLRILRARPDRARFFALFASISSPAAAGAGAWNRSNSHCLRCQSRRAGLVRMEFYPRKLGRLTEK